MRYLVSFVFFLFNVQFSFSADKSDFNLIGKPVVEEIIFYSKFDNIKSIAKITRRDIIVYKGVNIDEIEKYRMKAIKSGMMFCVADMEDNRFKDGYNEVYYYNGHFYIRKTIDFNGKSKNYYDLSLVVN